LIALVILYYLSDVLKLKTMSFLMSNIFNVGLIVLAIVFQPELRRALDQVGRTKIANFALFSSSGDDTEKVYALWVKAIDAVCDSAAQMSRQQIGALIAIERQTRMGDVIKTGTVINSDPSMELIDNIFFPNSPLHDGALIIREGRLCAAGCFLPLSENFEISRELGTRHRAALGLSEVSDAVVIVVSEETGVITVAKNGKLKRNYTKDMLKQELKAEILGETEDGTPEKKRTFWKVKK
ncbi:MAG TPA: TIGR00159 family protein, partial [Ruminococcaceae bacterium]|nr:TIGR00159 family protein [Oscillospiraceae bacterium]